MSSAVSGARRGGHRIATTHWKGGSSKSWGQVAVKATAQNEVSSNWQTTVGDIDWAGLIMSPGRLFCGHDVHSPVHHGF